MDFRSLVTRVFGEKRSLEDPRTPLSQPEEWLFDAFGARKSSAGVRVTPDNALEVPAVWAATRMISSTLATLPLVTYARTPHGKDRAPLHPVYRLLHDRPNPEQSSFVFRETLAAWLLLYGNAYAEIERNGAGEPVALWPLHPMQVRTERLENGAKVYVVRVDGQDVPLAPENVLHVPGFSLDGHTGLIPIHLARNTIGLAKATEEFGSSFFSNGAAPSGLLSHPAKLGPDGLTALRASWDSLHAGLSNAQRVAILEEGMTFTPMGLAPEHAQYLESRKFSVAEIARLFLIPPHMIGDLENGVSYASIEQQAIAYVTHCIEPWTRRIEQEINFKLFPADSPHFAEFILEGLLRGDSAARSAWYTAMSNLGVYSINEIRERENLNRVDGGDARFVPMNMQQLGAEVAV
jgi:HK97 family phage portal protein